VTESSRDAQAFLFRAVTANDRVQRLEAEGLLREPTLASSQGRTERTILDDFAVEVRVEAKQMGSVYELLYCLENSVRELIESTLIEAHGPEDWWSVGVPEKIRKSAESRAGDDERAPWHGPRGESLLVYTDFLQLAEIISENWSCFSDLLGDETWVTNYFREMNRSRRALAHTGSLTQNDVSWMEMRVRQWLMVVG
jgi:hypothetical protein